MMLNAFVTARIQKTVRGKRDVPGKELQPDIDSRFHQDQGRQSLPEQLLRHVHDAEIVYQPHHQDDRPRKQQP